MTKRAPRLPDNVGIERASTTGTSTPGQEPSSPPSVVEPESTTATNYLSDYTAPIYMPRREKLAVTMVPSDLVYKYQEAQSDEGKMTSWFFTFVGAFLGVIINWVTSDPIYISQASIFAEIILLAVVVLTGSFAYTFRKRARDVKAEIDQLIKVDAEEQRDLMGIKS